MEDKIRALLDDSMSLVDFRQVGLYEYELLLSGGDNSGVGLWSKYLEILYDLVLELESMYEHVAITSIQSDLDDDVFYTTLYIYTEEAEVEVDE